MLLIEFLLTGISMVLTFWIWRQIHVWYRAKTGGASIASIQAQAIANMICPRCTEKLKEQVVDDYHNSRHGLGVQCTGYCTWKYVYAPDAMAVKLQQKLDEKKAQRVAAIINEKI